jgi:uncharacterized protein YqjF (DUF2071 family)
MLMSLFKDLNLRIAIANVGRPQAFLSSLDIA